MYRPGFIKTTLGVWSILFQTQPGEFNWVGDVGRLLVKPSWATQRPSWEPGNQEAGQICQERILHLLLSGSTCFLSLLGQELLTSRLLRFFLMLMPHRPLSNILGLSVLFPGMSCCRRGQALISLIFDQASLLPTASTWGRGLLFGEALPNTTATLL